MKVLLAEDNLISQLAVRTFLEKQGHVVVGVNSGDKVIAALEEEGDFEVVLMDIQMPGMDGVQAAKLIREAVSENINPDIPIVALTAYAMKGDRERFMDAGMDEYLSKPLDMEEILVAMAKVTGKSID